MADLYATLLAYTIPVLPGQLLTATRLNAPLAALRVVVELHAPVGIHRWCQVCYERTSPCSTIQAIARELGVDG